MKKLIGITGKAGHGKDTAGRILAERLHAKTYAFASPIKDACKVAFGLTDDHLHGDLKETPIAHLGVKSPRQIMQMFGTDFARKQIADDVWIKRAALEFRRSDKSLIITDVRFENEAAWIREMGGTIIKVHREDTPTVNPHESEGGISPELIDITIDNSGTLAALKEKLYDLDFQRAAILMD